MRKPRDYDAELKALDDKARRLKERRVQQLGDLVIACRADTLPMEQLAGALLSAAETGDAAIREAWRKRGAAFFQRAVSAGGGARRDSRGAAASGGGTPPQAGEDRA
ncbi:MAG: conjugal transfer protein TraD [Sphingomonas sp.]|uniref:conjugal transfer protein TraD n=1 Tax=Sphingomonas sp. TaxID=28214 RepID=UPI001B0EBFC3|nr:conjugal transfer protein TraD [Sphingomonas sp.]MBO9621533.1 conjugal transfer protein TraD [Sphingomonas sp.]